jgi:CheY-like chemotaxis protein
MATMQREREPRRYPTARSWPSLASGSVISVELTRTTPAILMTGAVPRPQVVAPQRKRARNPTPAAAFPEIGGTMISSDLDGLRVLVVEDDPIIALDVAASLTVAGATVVGPAYTVRQALELVDRSPVDVAVLDFRLEAETASPIAHRLVAMDIPFLFHTSSSSNPALAHPGVPIVDKPTRPEQLVAAVSALTRKR